MTRPTIPTCKFLLFVFLLFGQVSFGQDDLNLWLHQMKTTEGLPTTARIYSIFQDSTGFLWTGTESGLNRYDGHTLLQYLPNEADSNALSGGLVVGGFFEDSQNNLWFCNGNSIQCYNRQKDNFSSYTVKDARGLELQAGYKAFYLEQDSILWLKAGGDRAIFSFNIYTKKYSPPIGYGQFDIDIYPGTDKNGRLEYIFLVDGSKSKGLEVIEIGNNQEIINQFTRFDEQEENFAAFNVHSLIFESSEAVWFSTNQGILKWNIKTDQLTPFFLPTQQPNYIRKLDDQHFLITKFHKGLAILNFRTWEYFDINSRLIDDPSLEANSLINDSYVDPNGHLWINLQNKGCVFGDPEKIKFAAIRKPLTDYRKDNYAFRSIVHYNDSLYWATTLRDGIFIQDKKGHILDHVYQATSQEQVNVNFQINHIIVDRDSRAWIATPEGVRHFDPQLKTFTTLTDQQGKPIKLASYIYQLNNGEILVSTLQNGIFKICTDNQLFFLKQVYAPTDKNDYFFSIYQDSLGSIYVSHQSSEVFIFNYSAEKLQLLLKKPIKGYVTGYFEEPNGSSLWMATGRGLVHLNKTNLKESHQLIINTEDLQKNDLQSLLLGKDGQLWMGTSGGLVSFDRQTEQFTSYSLADGTQSTQFHTLAAMANEDGILWFGGDNGITVVDPDKITPIQTKPKIHLTEILVNDKVDSTLEDAISNATNVMTFSRIVQPYSDNTLSFSFVAIDYSDPHSTQLEYKMEGYDKEWVRLKKGEKGFARYPRLPPDDYTFQIRAANSDSIWSEEVKTLAIRIKPPWYQTWWAISLFVLAGLGIIYGVYRYRVYQIQKEEAHKRKEAEYKQQVAETETAILRLQMNPHFIFNSMNSISSYIEQKDIDTANDYLNRFAKLMRTILKQAEKPFLSLYEEQDLLQQYLNTEAMRFEDNIDYQFKMSEDMDPEDYIIPTMILQPFIENAIWHGLANKKGAKKITIGFEVEGEELLCSVEDNGVGRSASSEFKSASSSHESKAIKITQRRLEILEEREKRPTKLSIQDLKDDEGRPAGTKVIIRLPVL